MRAHLVLPLALATAIGLVRCGPPPVQLPPGGGDGGDPDAGQSTFDAGPPIAAPEGSWSWVPVEGSQCASGSTAGLGINPGGDNLLIYLEGGGACWNQGTCVPSMLQYGPLCDYGTFCLLDVAGGTQPASIHVTEADPYPRDGGGAFPGALKVLTSVRSFDRADPENPFRDATFVFVPYCTGDVHSGAGARTYQYKYNLFDQPSSYTVHFNGANNVELYLRRLAATRPNARRVWLTGSSAGGYGATFNFERARRIFPNAEVHLLADCSPFIQPVHWEEWRDTWAMQLPSSCPQCDAGMPQVMEHLSSTYPSSRLGLLAYDHDAVVSWFFLAGPGAANALNPPTGAYNVALNKLEDTYDAYANSRYFNVPGDSHVLWGAYGSKLADGGYTAPPKSRDGGSDLKRFVDGWATGGPGWSSAR